MATLKQECETKASSKPGGGGDVLNDLCPGDCNGHGTCNKGMWNIHCLNFYNGLILFWWNEMKAS